MAPEQARRETGLESYLIAPLVQQQAVYIPPAAVITAQFIGGIGAGAVGVILATPLTIVAIVLVQTLYVEDALGDDVTLRSAQAHSGFGYGVWA